MIPVLLGKNCENVVVWKPGNLNKQQLREIYVEPGEVRFSRVYAMYVPYTNLTLPAK